MPPRARGRRIGAGDRARAPCRRAPGAHGVGPLGVRRGRQATAHLDRSRPDRARRDGEAPPRAERARRAGRGPRRAGDRDLEAGLRRPPAGARRALERARLLVRLAQGPQARCVAARGRHRRVVSRGRAGPPRRALHGRAGGAHVRQAAPRAVGAAPGVADDPARSAEPRLFPRAAGAHRDRRAAPAHRAPRRPARLAGARPDRRLVRRPRPDVPVALGLRVGEAPLPQWCVPPRARGLPAPPRRSGAAPHAAPRRRGRAAHGQRRRIRPDHLRRRERGPAVLRIRSRSAQGVFLQSGGGRDRASPVHAPRRARTGRGRGGGADVLRGRGARDAAIE